MHHVWEVEKIIAYLHLSNATIDVGCKWSLICQTRYMYMLWLLSSAMFIFRSAYPKCASEFVCVVTSFWNMEMSADLPSVGTQDVRRIIITMQPWPALNTEILVLKQNCTLQALLEGWKADLFLQMNCGGSFGKGSGKQYFTSFWASSDQTKLKTHSEIYSVTIQPLRTSCFIA